MAGEDAAITDAIRLPLVMPQFAYTRPETEWIDYSKAKPNDIYRLYNWHIIAMKDAAGFFTFNYGYPTLWSYVLARSAGSIPGFQEYTRHKFVLYDHFDAGASFDSVSKFAQWFARQPAGAFIDGPGQGLTVERFNANELWMTAHFPAEKFLVYNDSYHSRWRATINGKKVPLYRANFAFKGIQVPAGLQKIRFEYEPVGGSWIYMGILAFFYLYCALCVLVFTRRDKIA